MKKLRVLAAVMVVALALLAIWVAGTGPQAGGPAANAGDTSASAYDYEAHDVVVQQMGPDGALQYELEAKQITQLPRNGQISASDLTMHYDPPGTTPGGKNRWTLSADRADLPEEGGNITLNGKVRAQGLPVNAPAPVLLTTDRLGYNLTTQVLTSNSATVFTWGSNDTPGSKRPGANVLTTEQLSYNLTTQDVASESQVAVTWGRNNKLRGRGLRANIKSGDVALQSQANATLNP